jgi:hypothetical protein
MKKIFTLLVASCFLTAAFAQTGSRDTRTNQQYDQRVDQKSGQWDNHQYDQRNGQQNGQWDNNNSYSNPRDLTRNDGRFGNDDRFNNSNSIAMQIAQINRKYDFQVQQVQNSFFMRRYEKMRMIHSLEAQRQQEIRMLYARSSNRQHDRGFDSNHRY